MRIFSFLVAFVFLFSQNLSAEEQHGLSTVFIYRGYHGCQTAIYTFAGKPLAELITPNLDCVWGLGETYHNRPIQNLWPSLKNESFLTIRWVGRLKAPRPGTWTLRFGSDQAARLMVNGRLLTDTTAFGRTGNYQNATIEMAADRDQEIVVEFCNWSNGMVRLLWKGPGENDFSVVPQSAFSPCPPEPEGKTIAAPTVTPRTGFVGGRFYAEVTAPAGTYARYTLDGTEPTRLNGALYTVPVAITGNVTLAVRAFHPDGGQSAVVSKAFTVPETPLQKDLSILRTGNSLTNNSLIFYPALEAAGGYNIYITKDGGPKKALGAHVGGAGVGTKWLWEHHIEKPEKPQDDVRKGLTASAPYDCVITQPFWSWGDMDVAEEAEYTGRFYDLARASSPKADLWLYSQWKVWEQPRDMPKDTRKDNEEKWLAGMARYVVSFEELRTKLQAKYPDNKVRIIPVAQAALALHQAIKAGTVPGMQVYERDIMSDGIHFSHAGSYFITLVFYATLHDKSPVGLVIADTGLSIEQQTRLQQLAWEVVKNYKEKGVTASQPK